MDREMLGHRPSALSGLNRGDAPAEIVYREV
jgi:hypothetical protein